MEFQQRQEETQEIEIKEVSYGTTTTTNGDDKNTTGMGDLGHEEDDNGEFVWTVATVFQSLVLFGIAGVAEIMGGWMVWMAIRGNSDGKKPWWYAFVGSLVLICYGFIPTLQPLDSFGRIYAAYGGFFIVLSFLFGWVLDGDKPDVGDIVGGAVSLVGVFLILFWPREG